MQASFSKILVAFDGSDDSQKAIEMAAVIAKKFEASVVVVHVFAPPSVAYSGVSGMPIGDYKSLEDAAKDQASSTLAKGVKAATGAGVMARGQLLEGTSPVEAILEYSSKEKVDLIVAGTRGMTGLKRLVMGSVSSGLVTHAGCPVLVAR